MTSRADTERAGDDGAVTYYATYTTYDGVAIRQQLLETTDFRMFTSSPVLGHAAGNKGLALFRPGDRPNAHLLHWALVLDLHDPTIVCGLNHPLMAPPPGDRDGYVPNVVYSCGALRHDDRILLRLGTADSRISFATPHRHRRGRRSDTATTETRRPWPTSHHANINRRRPARR